MLGGRATDLHITPSSSSTSFCMRFITCDRNEEKRELTTIQFVKRIRNDVQDDDGHFEAMTRH